MCHRALPAAFVLLIMLAAVGAVPTADARAPPTPVCGVCSFDGVVDGTVVATDESQLVVSIHENGSTTWVAQIELSAGSDALAKNDSLRRAVVDEAMGRSIADPTAVQSQVDSDTLVVRYRDDEAAKRHVGTVVFTPLTPDGSGHPFASGGQRPRSLGTDRFTLRAPAGYDLYGQAESADSGVLVWTRANATERTSLDVAADPVAVDAEAGTPGVRTWFARLLS